MSRAALLFSLCFFALPCAAAADAIEGPPACPPGAVGRSSHSGQWCVAAPCASDADCAQAGGHCRAWRVCTRRASIPPGGLGQFRDPPPPPDEADLVIGSCDPARACRGDEEPPPAVTGSFVGEPSCVDATFCVPEALPGFPAIAAPPPASGATSGAPVAATEPAHSSCSCAAAGSHGSAGLSVLALVLAALVMRRRR